MAIPFFRYWAFTASGIPIFGRNAGPLVFGLPGSWVQPVGIPRGLGVPGFSIRLKAKLAWRIIRKFFPVPFGTFFSQLARPGLKVNGNFGKVGKFSLVAIRRFGRRLGPFGFPHWNTRAFFPSKKTFSTPTVLAKGEPEIGPGPNGKPLFFF